MVSFILPIIWSLAVLYKLKYKKNVYGLLFLSLIIPPTVNIVNSRINTMYYLCIFLMLMIVGKRLIIGKIFLNSAIVMTSIIAFYFIAWGLKGSGSFFYELIGDIKFIVLLIEFAIIMKNAKCKEIDAGFQWALKFSTVINFLVVIGTFIIPMEITKFVLLFYYNDDTINSIDNFVDGRLARAYGVFNHPAVLSIFSLMVFFYFFKRLYENKKNIIYMIMALIMGMSAYSKTFILGLPIIFLIWMIFNIKNIKIFILFNALLCILMGIYANFEIVIERIRDINPVLAYYMNYLNHPIEALATRYSPQTGNMVPMYYIIRQNLLIGVGPNPVGAETVVDSAPLVIIHNGGLLALSLILAMYIVLLSKSIQIKNDVLVCFLFIIILSGLALPTWIFHQATFMMLVYIIIILSKSKNKILCR